MTDWDTYGEAARALTGSPEAVMRALGHGALGVPTPFPDTDSGLAEIQWAHAELEGVNVADHDLRYDLVAASLRWVEARVAAAHGDLQAGLQGCLDFLAKCREIDYHLTITPRAARLAAICQVLLGEPASAVDTIAGLEEIAPTIFNTEDIRAYALLAQGRLAEARPLVRAQAQEGLSGRLPGQVCDAVVLLAALAYAEGDLNQAGSILRHMGAGLEPGVMQIAADLANRLGCGSEHADLQHRAFTYNPRDPQGLKGTRMAGDAVRAELARRGWE